MTNPFSTLLVKLRQEAGYDSSMGFFTAGGGRAHFGCTYKQYLNVENGRSLPNPLLLERVAASLRLSLYPEKGKTYVFAYLRALLRREPLVEFISAMLSGAAPAADTPLRQALRRHGDERCVPLTPAQSLAMRGSAESYLCFSVLTNDKGRHEARALAKRLALPLPAVKKALAGLLKAKLIACAPDGRWYCPKAGWLYQHPRTDLYLTNPEAGIACERLTATSRKLGKVLSHNYLLIRAPESGVRAYLPHLAQAVYGADVYSTLEKGPDTSLVLVEAVTRRVMPF